MLGCCVTNQWRPRAGVLCNQPGAATCWGTAVIWDKSEVQESRCIVGGNVGARGNSLPSAPKLFKCRPTPHCSTKRFPHTVITKHSSKKSGEVVFHGMVLSLREAATPVYIYPCIGRHWSALVRIYTLPVAFCQATLGAEGLERVLHEACHIRLVYTRPHVHI